MKIKTLLQKDNTWYKIGLELVQDLNESTLPVGSFWIKHG